MILEGGRIFDYDTNLIFPWYTKGFIEKLTEWDISDWKVFEYGAGDSTKWWAKKTRQVYSVDSNEQWAEKSGATYISSKKEFINHPLNFIDDEKFDCIIIDGDPADWRDDCTEVALKCIKDGGIIIIDNYNQASINLEVWKKTDELLKNKEKHVFQQDGHRDWKTAYWII
jgi:predicted O-methyltransferase YrrM